MEPVDVLRELGSDAERLFPQVEQLAEWAASTENEEVIENVQEVATYFAWVRQSVLAFAFDSSR